MDVYESFHDFLRLLYNFLEPLFSILAWFIDQGYLLGCSLTQRVKVRITKQAPTHRNKRVKSSDLKCGRFLGEGRSGIIYEATWSRGRNISLLARKAFPAVPADVFEYEAARLVELDHPNIVKVLGWTVDKRSCSLVMDHMKYDLFSVVEKRKEAMRYGAKVNFSSTVPIPLREAVHIISQIAEGMKYVHEQRLAHGDLKPNNVLVDSESGLMVVKVTDYGLTETKKRSTTLVPHQARCLQILTWKAPELFEDLLGSSTEDSENMWTEMFPDLEVVKTSHASSSVTLGSAESKMQLADADVYSFALTCSYILGAKIPHDSYLGLHEFRNGISSGARPRLPFECPKVLASLISECWDTIPSRRPAFIDICKEMLTVKWELKQHEEKVQEYRNFKPQGSRKGGPSSLTITFLMGGMNASLTVSVNKYKTYESTIGNILHISKEISDHVPQIRHRMFSSTARAWGKVELSTDTWNDYPGPMTVEYQDLREKLEELKAHTEWGHFFFDFYESGLEIKGKFAAGAQSVLYEGEWKRDDGKFHSVAIKELKDRHFIITKLVMHFFNSKGTEANLRTSRVLRPLGGTLFKNGNLALVYERCWGDLGKLINFQMLMNKDVEIPPFKQEMAVDIMLQIAEGMVELHEFGLLHRDVKSMNVLVRDLEKFSIGGSHGLISCALIDYEASEGVVGTWFWRAPEVLASTRMGTLPTMEFTPAMDVYSYGMTCYEILTGKIPFKNERPTNYELILFGGRPELPASVHPQLRNLVERCWVANPLERPTFQEIVLLLKNIQTGKMMLPPMPLDPGAFVMAK